MSRAALRKLRLPVMAAPMFLVSGPDMVIAAARSGIAGAFPTPNCRTADELDRWMQQIAQETADAPGTLVRRWASKPPVQDSAVTTMMDCCISCSASCRAAWAMSS